MKKIYRLSEGNMLAGICAGIGDMLGIDPTIVRLCLVFLTWITGIFPLIVTYLIGWVIIPQMSRAEVENIKKT